MTHSTQTSPRAWHPEPRDINPDEPFTFPEWSEVPWLDIDTYKRARRRALRMWDTARRPMMKATRPDGSLLYRMTDSGGWARTKPLSKGQRQKAVDRDGGCCVLCGSPEQLEVDHIIRYVDGGSNDLDNLRTLCRKCHGKRGGQA